MEFIRKVLHPLTAVIAGTIAIFAALLALLSGSFDLSAQESSSPVVCPTGFGATILEGNVQCVRLSSRSMTEAIADKDSVGSTGANPQGSYSTRITDEGACAAVADSKNGEGAECTY